MALTGGIRSLVKHELYWSNFYIGVDSALAAFANSVINVVDLSKGIKLQDQGNLSVPEKLVNNAYLLLLSFSILVFVMVVHQRFDVDQVRGNADTWQMRRGFWLGIVSNAFGLLPIAVFIYYRLIGDL